jgi:hypothetical protein
MPLLNAKLTLLIRYGCNVDHTDVHTYREIIIHIVTCVFLGALAHTTWFAVCQPKLRQNNIIVNFVAIPKLYDKREIGMCRDCVHFKKNCDIRGSWL